MDETARFNQPSDLALDNRGNLYVLDVGNHAIRRIDASGQVSTLPGSYDGNLVANPAGDLFLLSGDSIFKVAPDGNSAMVKTYPQRPGTSHPVKITFDGQGRLYVVMDYRNRWHVERSTLDSDAADYIYIVSTWDYISGIAANAQGDLAASVSDPTKGELKKSIFLIPASIQPAQQNFVQPDPAQPDTPGIATLPVRPREGERITFDTQGNLYLLDYDLTTTSPVGDSGVVSGMRVVKVAPDGTVRTLLNGFPDGSTAPRTWQYGAPPPGIVVSKSGDVYLSDVFDNAIYKIAPSGLVTLVAGRAGEAGSAD